jgi:chemotaxis protein CheY-P-specific phosphatase CheC
VNAEALTRLIAEGSAKSADSLSQITDNKWEVKAVELCVEGGASFDAMLASIAKDHYGSHFSIPGATFLVMFSGKSGYLVTTAFTRDHQDRVEGMEKRESKALAEAANIFLNPLIGHLASAWKRSIIISAPQMQVASQRELLTSALSRFKDQDALAAAFHIKLSSANLFSDCAVMIFLDAALAGLAG